MAFDLTDIERATATLDPGWRAAGIPALLDSLGQHALADEHVLAWCPGQLSKADVSAVVAVTDLGVLVATSLGGSEQIPWAEVEGIATMAKPTRALVISSPAADIVLTGAPTAHLVDVVRAATTMLDTTNLRI